MERLFNTAKIINLIDENKLGIKKLNLQSSGLYKLEFSSENSLILENNELIVISSIKELPVGSYGYEIDNIIYDAPSNGNILYKKDSDGYFIFSEINDFEKVILNEEDIYLVKDPILNNNIVIYKIDNSEKNIFRVTQDLSKEYRIFNEDNEIIGYNLNSFSEANTYISFLNKEKEILNDSPLLYFINSNFTSLET